jgi:hypothetical protein
MPLKLDDFDPISENELRELWAKYRDRDVRRLILEVERARRVIKAALGDAQQAQYGIWNSAEHQRDSALKRLLTRLADERVRLGSQGGIVVKLQNDGQYLER